MRWLPSNGYNWTSGPCIHFIINQMSQSLIINGTDENGVLKFLTTVRVEHDLISILLIPETVNLFCFLLHVKWSEWSSILKESTLQSRHFSDQRLDNVPDCHSRRNAMRINDHVRNNTIHCEWKILLTESHTTSTFLTMSGGEFVTDLRNSHTSNSYFGELVTSSIFRDNNKIHNSLLSPSGSEGRVFVFSFSFESISISVRWK